MPRPPSRFSHRHLLALGAYLVPLAFLAALGWNELQRTSATAQQALAGEARQFLAAARQAVDQQIERHVPALLEESKRWLAQHGVVRTTITLAAEERFAALRGIVLLDDLATVIWPALPLLPISLPLASEEFLSADSPLRGEMQRADHHLSLGQHAEAILVLEQTLAKLDKAWSSDDDRRPDLQQIEAVARFRLATAHRALREVGQALEEWKHCKRLVDGMRIRRDSPLPALGLLSEFAIALAGPTDERLRLLRAIAEGRRDQHPDGLLTALAQRLGESIDASDALREQADTLLREERQRAAIRSFAAEYENNVKPWVRRSQRSAPGSDDGPFETRLVAPVSDGSWLVSIRPATADEAQQWNCASVAIQVDPRALLAATFASLNETGGRFVLAVHDADDQPLVPPPRAAPADYEPPSVRTDDLLLRAWPADPQRLVAEAEASKNMRTLLVVALFAAALGGALWSWRSVSRETELAALKVDLVSRVSHELKTPLALVRMYGETLGMGRARDAGQAAEFGSIIAREAERLTAMIQRILDFSRQQAGTLDYHKEPLDLGELLREITATYTPHLESRGAILIDSLPLGIRVQCDRNGCENAIVNLLENAAKYAREGDDEHEIELVLERHGESAVVEVRDRGRGIPPGEHTRVFDGFYRASNAGEVRGAGLGLGLVRHFARAHGGEILALPREGGGTVMRLELPLAGTPPPASGPPPRATDP